MVLSNFVEAPTASFYFAKMLRALLLCLSQLSHITVASSVGGTSVTLTPVAAIERSTPTKIEFGVTATSALAIGEKITITASEPIWLYVADVTCTWTLGGSADTSLFAGASGFSATSTTVMEATAAAAVSAGDVLVFSCTSNFAQHRVERTVVTFSMVSTTDTTAVTGITGWTTVAAGVGEDPVARFGDREVEFELPVGKLTDLVTTDHLIVQSSVFEGAYWNTKRGSFQEQWFDRFVLKTPSSGQSGAQDRFLDIKIKRDLHKVNVSRVPNGELFTLDITMGYGSVTDSKYTSKVTADMRVLPFWLLEQDVVIHRFSGTSRSFKSHRIGTIPSECVQVHGSLVEFAICSRPAHYYTGHLRQLSVKYAHLDMTFLNIKDTGALRGVLPELWGLVPMSESTKSYVKKPLKLRAATSSNVSCMSQQGIQLAQDVADGAEDSSVANAPAANAHAHPCPGNLRDSSQ